MARLRLILQVGLFPGHRGHVLSTIRLLAQMNHKELKMKIEGTIS